MPAQNSDCWCIVIANGARARFFTLQPTSRQHPPPEVVLQERDDLVHPNPRTAHSVALHGGNDTRRTASGGAGRNDDASEANWRREQDRRFAAQIVDKTAECCRQWHASDAVLVADKRSLGLLRQKRDRLSHITVHELSRDLSHVTLPALYECLRAAGLVPHPEATLRHRFPAAVVSGGKAATLDHGKPHPQPQGPAPQYRGAATGR